MKTAHCFSGGPLFLSMVKQKGKTQPSGVGLAGAIIIIAKKSVLHRSFPSARILAEINQQLVEGIHHFLNMQALLASFRLGFQRLRPGSAAVPIKAA
jgi:hypothetical protein